MGYLVSTTKPDTLGRHNSVSTEHVFKFGIRKVGNNVIWGMRILDYSVSYYSESFW